MKTKLTAGALPHDEVITVPQDYTQRRLNIEEIEKAYPEAYKWAREFHNLYEETAPMFGYETRKETKEFDPKSSNGRLMAYVCFNIIHQALAEERERVKVEIEEIPDTLNVENNNSQQIYENWGRQAMKRDILSSLDKEINNQ